MNLTPRGQGVKDLKLSLQGMNCLATIQRIEATEEDIKVLKKIDHDDRSCNICLDSIKSPYELKCGHDFCKVCITNWLQVQKVCPICREPAQI